MRTPLKPTDSARASTALASRFVATLQVSQVVADQPRRWSYRIFVQAIDHRGRYQTQGTHMPKTRKEKLAPDTIGVRTIPTSSLVPNPHNPRMLFDKGPLNVLQESIDKVGILVPLTVYWSDERDSFVILDGQRRWICAQALRLTQVPVNQVAEPDIVQNIVTMFQIHKFREDWELMPTALKLEVLMDEMKEKNARKLASLTGLDQAVVARCKKLLTYPKKYQDLMLDEDPIKRVKADFFIELYPVVNDRFVKTLTWYSKDSFTQQMLGKYLAGANEIKSVTDFRTIKQHISNARRVGKLPVMATRLEQFTADDSLPLSHLEIPAATVSAGARKLLSSVLKLTKALKALDIDDYYGEEQLWMSLAELGKLIRARLLDAGKRPKE